MAETIKKELKERLVTLQNSKSNYSFIILIVAFLEHNWKIYDKPVLGYILVGHNPDSEIYVRMKRKTCEELGIECEGL